MLPENITAGFLAVCLASFFLVNLYNIVKFHRGRRSAKPPAAIESPRSLTMPLAALGTLLFFLESILFSLLALTGFASFHQIAPLQLRFQHDTYVQIIGIVLSGAGYFLFIWSVVARGRYAVSWGMPENQRLVTWGPNRYVRHPSYIGYFLMFSGLFLVWLNLVAILPLIAIPGYIQVTATEEQLLLNRFGEEYKRYQRKTGKFFPKRK